MATAEQNRENQRRYYLKNKEKISEIKKKYRAENYERIRQAEVQRCKYMKKERPEKPKEVINIQSFEHDKKLSIYQVMDILKKDNKSYLWNKPIRSWIYQDWVNFKSIQNI